MGILVNGKMKYRLDRVLSYNPNIVLIHGGRDIGKTYATRELMLEHACKHPDDSKFIYIRRYSEDIKPMYANKYFSSKDTKKFIKKFTNGKYDSAIVKGNDIFTAKMKDNLKYDLGYKIGYTMALALEERYKSLDFDDVENMIFEEWQTVDRYLKDEPAKVKSLLSTVKRDRKDVKLFMICNTISPVSPYILDWDLHHIPYQEQGTIDIYNLKTSGSEIIKIACEYCGEKDLEHTFISKKSGNMENTGEWKSSEYPNIKYIKENDRVFHTVVFQYDSFMFIMRLIKVNNDFIWSVERKTSPIKDNTRIVGNIHYFNRLYTNDFVGISKEEEKAFSLIKMGKIAFADNLTGSMFYTCLKNFK